MQRKFLYFLAFTLILSSIFVVVAAQDDAPVECALTENQLEVIDENTFTLIRLTSNIEITQSPEGIFNGYYLVLISMRQYHEELAAELPDCAQEINEGFIDVIVASQDAVTLLYASDIAENGGIYSIQLDRAQDYLVEQWGELNRALDRVELVEPQASS